jgi:hypothetical protein
MPQPASQYFFVYKSLNHSDTHPDSKLLLKHAPIHSSSRMASYLRQRCIRFLGLIWLRHQTHAACGGTKANEALLQILVKVRNIILPADSCFVIRKIE